MSEKKFQQPSVMTTAAHFAGVPKADIERSTFDRSHAYKTTFNAGDLIPFYLDEVLPGDSFNVKSTHFVRLATPLKPIMDNLFCDTQYFFVPARLVWDNWQAFMGERRNPDDDPSIYTVPVCNIDRSGDGDRLLWNYFGIPHDPAATVTTQVNALPFRCYALIWNEWYRDQNLQDRIPISFDDDSDQSGQWNNFEVLKRGKRHDYFCSCLPWPQAGEPVQIPIGDFAPVISTGDGAPTFETASISERGLYAASNNNIPITYLGNTSNPPTSQQQMSWVDPKLQADLSSATAITINELRTAFQIQKLLERDARGGSRYIELILSHFAVVSPDARMQRPEVLGAGSTRININPIASTAETASVPQANLSAIGTGVQQAKFGKSFTEHGYIIGIMSVRADLTYQQGLDRLWSRQTRYDFYWPAFAHLGEQAVLNKEIYMSPDGSTDDDVFGYQERFAEMRYKNSRITGLFASNNASSLDVWHLSQDFSALPALNDAFIQEAPPIARIVAVPSEPDFLADVWIDLKCTRPMPTYSVPGFVDHF